VGCCGNIDEPLGTKKCGEYLGQLRTHYLLEKDCPPLS